MLSYALVIWSKVYGTSWAIEEPDCKRNKVFYYLTTAVFMILLHLYTAVQTIYFIHEMKDYQNWYEATNMADVMAAIFTTDYMFIHRKELRKIIHCVGSFKFSTVKKQPLQNKRNILTIATLLFFVSYLSIVSTSVISWDTDFIFNDYFPMFKDADFHHQVKLFFVLLEWYIYVIYGWGSVAFFILLYSEIAIQLRDHFNCFCIELNNTYKRSIFLSLCDFRKFLRKHDDLCDLVTEVDCIFSSLVLSWFADFLIAVCVEVNGFLAGENDTLLAVGGSIIITFDLIYAIVAMVVICLAGCSVHEGSIKTIPAIVKLTRLKYVSLRSLYADIQLLIIKISGYPAYLSAGKCVVISRSLILTLLSILLTYILLLAQMNPKAMKYMTELNK